MLDLYSRANAKRLGIWLTCALLLACTDRPESPEEAVRAWVTEAVAAAENKDRRELLSLISPNYVDARGNERNDVGNLLRIYFLRQQKVAIMTKVRKITMLGDTAVAVHPDPTKAFDKIDAELTEKLATASAKEKESVQSQLDYVRERRESMLP